MVEKGQFETPKSTDELQFKVGVIEFHEILIVMEKTDWPNHKNVYSATKPHSFGHATRNPFQKFPIFRCNF